MAAQSLVQLRNRILKTILLTTCFVLLALYLARPINLTAVDIGRHIKNGELILQGQTELLHRNFYSFTHPDYPFINHHWLFGVMSFGVWKWVGFTGLQVVYIAVMLAALWFFVQAARLRGHFAVTAFFTALVLPILWSRQEIRPEGISILLMGLYFYLLTKLSLGRIKPFVVFIILSLAQIVWVNTHIFFFMGPLLVAVFLWDGYARGCSVCVRHLWPLLCLTVMVNMLNPSGLEGALTPFHINKADGYMLAENQNLFFMMSRFPTNKIYPYYLLLTLLVVPGALIAGWMKGWKVNWPFMALMLFAVCAGLKAVRLMSPVGFLLVPMGAFFYGQIEGAWPRKIQDIARAVFLAGAVVLCVVFAWVLSTNLPGIGLMPEVNRSAEFFKQAGLKGPIFSNYDIGGYLIFHLAPQEKVFVDNRQEAFPPEFFKNSYVPMQEDATIWRQMDDQYKFNVIYFYRHDLTPWGQNLLINRVKDPDWVPVFVDNYTIIFIKRNADNQPLIERFELPQSMFTVQRT